MIEIEGPDGVIYEFPQGTSDDVIRSAMRKQYGGAQEGPQPSVGRALGLTARAGAKGLAAVPSLVSDAIGATLNVGADALGYGHPFPTNHLGMVDSMLTDAGLPEPETRTEKISTAAAEFLAGAGSGIATGRRVAQASPGTTAGRAGAALAAQPGIQAGAATGAGIGAGSTDDPTMSAVLGLVGGVSGGMLTSALTARVAPETARAMRFARQEGVPLSAGDLGNRTAKSIEDRAANDMLSGRSSFLRRQNETMQAAVARGQSGASAGENRASLVEAFRDTYRTLRQRERALYDGLGARVNSEAGRARGLDIVAADRARARLRGLRDEYGQNVFDQADTANSVQQAFNRVADGDVQAVNYEQFLALRSAIGDRARQLAAARGNQTKRGALDQAYRALTEDLEMWGARLHRDDPEAASLFQRARDFSRTRIMPFRNDRDIYKIVNSKTTDDELRALEDTIYKRITKGPGKARSAMRLAGRDGRRAAQDEALRQLEEAGTNDRAQHNAPFSPAKYRNAVNRSEAVNEAILSPEQRARTDMLANLAGATSRSPMGYNTPQTGAMNTANIASMLGGAAGAATAGAPGAIAGMVLPRVGSAAATRALQQDILIRALNAQRTPMMANPGIAAGLWGD